MTFDTAMMNNHWQLHNYFFDISGEGLVSESSNQVQERPPERCRGATLSCRKLGCWKHSALVSASTSTAATFSFFTSCRYELHICWILWQFIVAANDCTASSSSSSPSAAAAASSCGQSIRFDASSICCLPVSLWRRLRQRDCWILCTVPVSYVKIYTPDIIIQCASNRRRYACHVCLPINGASNGRIRAIIFIHGTSIPLSYTCHYLYTRCQVSHVDIHATHTAPVTTADIHAKCPYYTVPARHADIHIT